MIKRKQPLIKTMPIPFLNKSEKAIQDEADIYRQVVEIADYLEMEEFVKEVEDTEVRNMVMINKSLARIARNVASQY